jgi:hypothetical protein
MDAHDAAEAAYRNGQQRAAREIIEELEKKIDDELRSNYQAREGLTVGWDEFENSLIDRTECTIAVLSQIMCFLDELKKKYT